MTDHANELHKIDGVQPSRIELSDGRSASIVVLEDGWALEIDGVRQSHVGNDSNPGLAVTRWMLAAIGHGAPLRCAHLGGALLALPRAVATARPGSTQTVVEIERALIELAQQHGLEPASTTVVEADARSWLDGAPHSEFDVVSIDVFVGGRIPPAFSTLECFAAASDALADGGVLIVNSVAGPELQYTSRALAAMQSVFSHVALIVQGSALGGLRFGNAVLLGSSAEFSVDEIRRTLRADVSKGALVTDISSIVGDAMPLRDADAVWSPRPDLPDARGALAALSALREIAEQATGIVQSGGRDSPGST